MNSKKKLSEKLKTLGCKANFKPSWDTESKSVHLETHRPAKIICGMLKGAMIDLYNDSTFRVWTPQVIKAKRCAEKFCLEIRLLDRECELFVPVALADKILPMFGAKVKREISSAHRARLAAILKKIRPQ